MDLTTNEVHAIAEEAARNVRRELVGEIEELRGTVAELREMVEMLRRHKADDPRSY